MKRALRSSRSATSYSRCSSTALELRQAADRLGVKVSENEVSKRLLTPSGGEQEGGSGGDTFPRDTVVAQLLTEGIFLKVTRDVRAPSQPELSARRNQAMTAFLARLKARRRCTTSPAMNRARSAPSTPY